MTASGAVEVIEGDITEVPVDAIVNAANSGLRAGGGVCGAIFRKAGMAQLSAACDALGGCPTGQAVVTPAFGIRTAKVIVHAVGPIYDQYAPDEARMLLRQAYESAIDAAARAGCTSIAFPAISTGIYGYPLEDACREAAEVCVDEARQSGMTVTLVAFDGRTGALLREAVEQARARLPPSSQD